MGELSMLTNSQWREIAELCEKYGRARATALRNERNEDVLWNIIIAADQLERRIKELDLVVDSPPF